MAPQGILREPVGSIANSNIWLMALVTDTVQFKTIQLLCCVCVCVCTSRRGRCGGRCLAYGRASGAEILMVTIQVQLPLYLQKTYGREKINNHEIVTTMSYEEITENETPC